MRAICMDSFIVFPTDAKNAIKAAQEIDQISYCNVQTFESVIAVMPDSPDVWKYSKPVETIKAAKKILNKYGIPYKNKKMSF